MKIKPDTFKRAILLLSGIKIQNIYILFNYTNTNLKFKRIIYPLILLILETFIFSKYSNIFNFSIILITFIF